ncbi:RagB/SusD family nutrient uptake outer membrane protein [Chitinophaga pendula]|uniref:RagB/SusD family nutrient uptake outer membrane protein n=1 Tax=Chitinophaga TaxID=79328 RepID=UPI000BAF1FA0|nr:MULTISPECIES: RagB/SusD family nutrient uptake outer membrane protein [Chitinophaga]ASZ11611.1 RagB/SusD family nutrient uptake outer membrane protein [Chitinophaga sp. MD30]UCJ05379.1 RagB/SusD family nutrient uptake outer membrane protein [Chitinophaga pendula]
MTARRIKPLSFVLLVMIGTVCLLGNTACKKFLQIDPPIDRLKSDLVFTDDALATAGITGLYSKMAYEQNAFSSYSFTLYPALSADEMINTYVDAELTATYENAIPATAIMPASTWTKGYQYIYHTNACLTGLAGSKLLTTEVKQQLEGEMRFMRAFCYFYMVNFFGDVPLLLSTDFRLNNQHPRTSADKVYEQIITDLELAVNNMSSAYVTNGRARPNKWTAAALLARVYLYRKEWEKAEQYASNIINSKLYQLVEDPGTIFANANSEAIWQLVYSVPNNLRETQYFIPADLTTSPLIRLSDQLAGMMSDQDKRKLSWVGTVTLPTGDKQYYVYKYKVKIPVINVSESITVFRLAEQYLIRAEARLQQRNISGAIEDIDVIRKRAGLPAVREIMPHATITDLLALTARERNIELLAEWGHRWFDLKRTGSSTAVLSAIKKDWQPADTLYPLPQDQLLMNSTLTQNPGY